MKKVLILGGGSSSEREISLTTSNTIKRALESKGIAVEIIDPADYENWADLLMELRNSELEIIFIGLHGEAGEDGRVQSMLELAGLPFTGSGSHASSLAMDKNTSLAIAKDAGITVAPHVCLQAGEPYELNQIIETVGLPMVIKPNSSGSSVGISIVRNAEEIENALEKAWQQDRYVLCEKYISGRELTVTILDQKALPVVEIKPHDGWYDYTNKYTHGKTEYICPAELTKEQVIKLHEMALKIYNCLGCSVYSRIDFRFDGEDFYFLEVNTLPGMTSLSLTPMAAKAIGLSLPQLLLKIIEISKRIRG